MYVCMYVCMYVWMHAWMDVCMYVCKSQILQTGHPFQTLVEGTFFLSEVPHFIRFWTPHVSASCSSVSCHCVSHEEVNVQAFHASNGICGMILPILSFHLLCEFPAPGFWETKRYKMFMNQTAPFFVISSLIFCSI